MQIKTRKAFVIISLLVLLVMVTNALLISVSVAYSVHLSQATVIDKSGPFFPIAVALCVGLSGIGAGYAMSKIGAAAISASVESEKSFTISLLIVSMAEAIAIYGLIVALLLIIL
ncbi:MAG: ATP synthase subunit C [Candidatus Helarchaeota archaeon]